MPRSEEGNRSEIPLGLYLHAPYCTSHCTYCDFFTRPWAGEEVSRRFARALAAEIPVSARETGVEGREVDTVYLGGGTPSLIDPCDLGSILDAAAGVFRILPGAEITLEANPESAGPARLREYRLLGVNRLSLGVQSFHPPILALLGRGHTASKAGEAIGAARRAGFENLNLDLMLALPGQDAASLASDLRAVLAARPEHVSAYLLEMDKESALKARIARGEIAAPSEEVAADLYTRVRETLGTAGYVQYEISNFALPGRECRHNLKYWTDLPFLGLGPSAWSYLGGRRFRVRRDLEGYLASCEHGVPPLREEEPPAPGDRMDEAIFAGLRLLEGIDLDRIRRTYGVADPLAGRRSELEDLAAEGLLRIEGDRLRLTERGLPLANEVFRVFVGRPALIERKVPG